MDKISKKFIEDWGKEIYDKVLESAEEHRNGINDREIGHKFKWALLICIGSQCMEKPKFRKYHGFPRLNWSKMKKWIKDNAELRKYKGDCDYLALASGAYDYYVKK